ncbi:hypothetical protein OSB04_001009 [Centaurea solstitialis]|uniref:Protein kinase domain-containing protein n=1 Tax=Centaurea solstitialis TaxID=347529 RepID=A0AA38U9G4_9ASTR|nr:hypothetical protein OSB04_001009 [Centaurea solstitialis]
MAPSKIEKQPKRNKFFRFSLFSLFHPLPSPSTSGPLQPVPRDNDDLRIALRDIVSATNNFDNQNRFHEDQHEDLYKSQLFLSGQLVDVVVQRLRCGGSDVFSPRDRDEVLKDISRLSGLKNKNVVSIVGFCDENDDEVIIVYEHPVNGTLDKHLPYLTLSWVQRLRICVTLAREIRNWNALGNMRISKILLDKDWEPMFLGISSYSRHHLVQLRFGMLLLDVLCDINKMTEDRYDLRDLFMNHYEQGTLDENIDYNLRKQMHPESLAIFSRIAVNCLRQPWENITDDGILRGLEKALELQLKHDNASVKFSAF